MSKNKGEWRSMYNDLPGWQDAGPAELKTTTGAPIKGRLSIYDEAFTHEFHADNGEKRCIHDFDFWRLI